MLDPKPWQALLETEQRELESQLARVARVNPQDKTDWQLKPSGGGEAVFRDEVADDLEEMDEREEIELTLEQRLREVRGALARIAAGQYGICEISGEVIEEERLKANPAARTCKAHRNEEKNLPAAGRSS